MSSMIQFFTRQLLDDFRIYLYVLDDHAAPHLQNRNRSVRINLTFVL